MDIIDLILAQRLEQMYGQPQYQPYSWERINSEIPSTTPGFYGPTPSIPKKKEENWYDEMIKGLSEGYKQQRSWRPKQEPATPESDMSGWPAGWGVGGPMYGANELYGASTQTPGQGNLISQVLQSLFSSGGKG